MVRYLRKSCAFLLIATLLFTLFPTWENVKADTTVVASGNCGNFVREINDGTGIWAEFDDASTWILYSDGTLKISGLKICVGLVWCASPCYLPFYGYENQISSVQIENGVTLIGEGSFSRLCKMESVTIPNSVTEIGVGAFNECNSLKNIEIPSTIKTINNLAFYKCSSLKSINIDNVTTVSDSAFSECDNLVIASNRADSQAVQYAKKNNIKYSYPSIKDAEITIPTVNADQDSTEYRPEITVKYKSETLVKDTDYSLEYKNNKSLGSASVVVTGLGKYGDSIEKEFVINKIPDLKDATVSLSADTFAADKTEKKPTVTVKYGDATLTENTDYTLAYKDNTNAGTATVTVTGIHKYAGTQEKTFSITGTSIEDAEVSLKKTIYTYDGSNKTPSATVTLDGKALTENEDYTISYKDNQDAGTGYLIVTGTGMYSGTVTKSFVILPYNSGMDSVYPDGTMISDSGVYGVTDDETNEVEYCCPSTAKTVDVKIPATVTDENGTVYKVTSIGKEAFYKNTKIESVEIGNNIKSIEDYAFYGCKNVKTIKIGNGVEIIGASSFRKCTKLTSVTLPKSLNELGKNAFYGCSKLKTITIKANSVVDVNDGAIKGISKKAVIKVPKKLIKKYEKEFNKKSGFKNTMSIKKAK